MFEPQKRVLSEKHGSLRTWYGLLVLAVICSLTFALATRFSVQTDSHVHSIKSRDNRTAESKQRFDQNHDRAAGPIAVPVTFTPAVVSEHVIPDDPTYSSYSLPPSLYHRPPPAA